MPLDVAELFEGFQYEHGQFDDIENKLSVRPEMHAFMLLDQILPNPGWSIIEEAEGNEIWLGAELSKLAEVASVENIRDLVRCGVLYDPDKQALMMWVG